jgi:hypothetical protein
MAPAVNQSYIYHRKESQSVIAAAKVLTVSARLMQHSQSPANLPIPASVRRRSMRGQLTPAMLARIHLKASAGNRSSVAGRTVLFAR